MSNIFDYDCNAKDFVIYDKSIKDNDLEDQIVRIRFNLSQGKVYCSGISEKFINQAIKAYKKENLPNNNLLDNISYITKTIRPKQPSEQDMIQAVSNYANDTAKTIPNNITVQEPNENKKKEKNKIASENIDYNKLSLLLSSVSDLKSLTKKREDEIIKYIAKSEKSKRKLYAYSKDELNDIEISESNEEFGTKNNDIDYQKFGKLRKRKGMSDKVLLAQAIIPDAKILPTNNMFQRIMNNYNSIISKYKSDKIVEASCTIQQMILSNVINKKITENVENTRYFSNDLSVYFPEVITPFALIYSNQNGIHFIEGAQEKLCQTLGIHSTDELAGISSISYPTSSSNLLTDSSVFINKGNKFYKIGLSTKAGRAGVGAQASISGLLPYIFDFDNPNINRNIFKGSRAQFDFSNYTQYLSIKSLELLHKGYYDEIAILGIFSLLSSISYDKIIDTLLEKWYGGKKGVNKLLAGSKNTRKTKYILVEKFMNENLHFTEVIMALLNYGAYDFAQVNMKQVEGNSSISESCRSQYRKFLLEKKKQTDIDILFNNRKKDQYIQSDWHYEVEFKYPAVFNGRVEMTFSFANDKPKKLKFHIF